MNKIKYIKCKSEKKADINPITVQNPTKESGITLR